MLEKQTTLASDEEASSETCKNIAGRSYKNNVMTTTIKSNNKLKKALNAPRLYPLKAKKATIPTTKISRIIKEDIAPICMFSPYDLYYPGGQPNCLPPSM